MMGFLLPPQMLLLRAPYPVNSNPLMRCKKEDAPGACSAPHCHCRGRPTQ